MEFGVWSVACRVWSAMCTFCSLLFTECRLQCVLFSLKCGLNTRFAVCSVECEMCGACQSRCVTHPNFGPYTGITWHRGRGE